MAIMQLKNIKLEKQLIHSSYSNIYQFETFLNLIIKIMVLKIYLNCLNNIIHK